MKAKELRIGNYVNRIVTPSMKNGRIKPSIDLWRIECTDLCSFENFEPIQLTEQWLIEFGFEKDGHDWYLLDGFLIGHITSDFFQTEIRFPSSDWRVITIKHVHQLQNLYFALTGEDLQL